MRWVLITLDAELDWGIAMDYNEHARKANDDVFEALMKQKKHYDFLFAAMAGKIKHLEDEIEDLDEMGMCSYYFFKKHHEMIPEYVALAYENCSKKNAISEVGAFHDETFDLSTLECTGTDFKGWKI